MQIKKLFGMSVILILGFTSCSLSTDPLEAEATAVEAPADTGTNISGDINSDIISDIVEVETPSAEETDETPIVDTPEETAPEVKELTEEVPPEPLPETEPAEPNKKPNKGFFEQLVDLIFGIK